MSWGIRIVILLVAVVSFKCQQDQEEKLERNQLEDETQIWKTENKANSVSHGQ